MSVKFQHHSLPLWAEGMHRLQRSTAVHSGLSAPGPGTVLSNFPCRYKRIRQMLVDIRELVCYKLSLCLQVLN
jgi:hypothetical protein